MIKGILWDNDGVLVETERLYYEVHRDLFLELGVEFTSQQFFDLLLSTNLGAWHLLQEKGYAENEIENFRNIRNQRYSQQLFSSDSLQKENMDKVVFSLASRLPMGIVTSARREDFDLVHKKLNLISHFNFVLTHGDYQESKPHPAPYLAGLNKIGLAASECLAIEDSPRGLQSANAAGLTCIILRNDMTNACKFEGADYIVNTPEELLTQIEKLL